MAYVGFRAPRTPIGFRNRARFADLCDPFWKFARLSGAILDKTASLSMLPTVARLPMLPPRSACSRAPEINAAPALYSAHLAAATTLRCDPGCLAPIPPTKRNPSRCLSQRGGTRSRLHTTQRAGGAHQLIEDRAIDDPQEPIQNLSALMRGGSAIGEGEAFAIRGFRQQ